jgi:ribosomal protein S18 acetylase RimI-like enzyme
LKKRNSYCRKCLSVSIRSAKLADTWQISSLFLEWLKEGTIEGRLEEIRKTIRAKEILVAEDRRRTKELVGFIHSIIHNDPISCGPLVYITAFYVQKQLRGKGIGSRMLEQVLDNSLANGVVGAEVATSHPRAIKLYRRFGFSQFKAEIGEIQLGLDLIKRKRREMPRPSQSKNRRTL